VSTDWPKRTANYPRLTKPFTPRVLLVSLAVPRDSLACPPRNVFNDRSAGTECSGKRVAPYCTRFSPFFERFFSTASFRTRQTRRSRCSEFGVSRVKSICVFRLWKPFLRVVSPSLMATLSGAFGHRVLVFLSTSFGHDFGTHTRHVARVQRSRSRRPYNNNANEFSNYRLQQCLFRAIIKYIMSGSTFYQFIEKFLKKSFIFCNSHTMAFVFIHIVRHFYLTSYYTIVNCD